MTKSPAPNRPFGRTRYRTSSVGRSRIVGAVVLLMLAAGNARAQSGQLPPACSGLKPPGQIVLEEARAIKSQDYEKASRFRRQLNDIRARMESLQDEAEEAASRQAYVDQERALRQVMDLQIGTFGEHTAKDQVLEYARFFRYVWSTGGERFTRAIEVYRRAVAIEICQAALRSPSAEARRELASTLKEVGRLAEAEEILLAFRANPGSTFAYEVENVAYDLGALLIEQQRYEEALPIALEIRNRELLIQAYSGLGRHKDAEPLIRASGDKQALSENLEAQGRFEEAARIWGDAPSRGTTERAARDTPDIATADDSLRTGLLLARGGQFADAVKILSKECSALQTSSPTDAIGVPVQDLAVFQNSAEFTSISGCYLSLALSQFRVLGTSGNLDPSSSAANLAFQAIQMAGSVQSTYAVSRGNARRYATSRGAGSILSELKTVQRQKFTLGEEMLESQSPQLREAMARMQALSTGSGEMSPEAYEELMKAAREAPPPTPEQTQASMRLMAQISALDQRIAELERQLQQRAPEFAERMLPRPMGLNEIAGSPASLLRANEALIVIHPGSSSLPDASSNGVVVVVTREAAAFANLGVKPGTLAEQIAALRQGLEGGSTARYDRDLSHRLYVALFGAPNVAALLATKDTWLIAPQGSLTSLPFAVLVTSPPQGGVSGDLDPAALRSTKWLGLERTLLTLPSIASLRDLRQEQRTSNAGALAFFGLGDPVLLGTQTSSRAKEKDGVPSFAHGAVDPEAIRSLPPLPETRTEIQTLARTLGAPSTAVLLGEEANERRLRGSQETLSQARVVAFATHGLVSGELGATQVEPGLALTPPPRDRPRPKSQVEAMQEDGFFSVSEIAELQLRADLVVLSACNTAAPGSGTSEGLSGLASAFLVAGARSLMVTHWRVEDDLASRVTTRTIQIGNEKGLAYATALRETMKEIFSDPSRDGQGSLAHPANWAPFMLVGAD